MARGTMFGLTDPNIFKVAIRYNCGLQKCQTGFKVRDVAAQDNDPEDVTAPVISFVNNFFKALLTTTDILVAVDVLKMGTDEGFTHSFVNVTGSINAAVDQRLPSFLAVNISMKTQLRKRYGQGRMFWPVRGEGYVAGDSLNDAGVTAYQGALDAFITAFTGSVATHDLLLVNTHGILPARAATGGTPARPEIPASWYDVESVKLNNAITSVRSRKVGVGG